MSDPDRRAGGSADRQPALLRVVADKLPAMLAYWDTKQRCRFANRAYVKWFGVDPDAMIGIEMKQLLGALYPLNLPHIEGALRGEAQEFERTIPDPEGGAPRDALAHYIPDIVDGVVRGFCVLVTDITRRKKAEEALHGMERQLQASERVAATATLAGGIAHEINNPLASVLGNLELSLELLDSGSADPAALRASLVDALEGTKRIRDIGQNMKLLARGDTAKRELVDVDDTLEKSIELASNAIRYRARLVREMHRPGHVHGSASQLAQVFVNLLVNAAHALPEGSASQNEIHVATRREGDAVVIEVRDNGCGIPSELQAHIFEPFFTTKDVGFGMGLGLSVARGILTAWGGTIAVTSTVGRGSVFRVTLPAVRGASVAGPEARETKDDRSLAPPSPAPQPTQPPQPTQAKPAVRPRILIIDDEVSFARSLRLLLALDGDVVVVHHGRDALAILADDEKGRFDVVFCDLMMPEVSGEDVYAAIAESRPDLARRFVFMTGGAFTPRGRQFLQEVQAPVLEKPFDIARLRALLTAATDRAIQEREER